jgi:hypothetical protein
MPKDIFKYSLRDYNQLAYEFAIRNPRVIELLGMPLTDENVKELLTYGIDATSCYNYHDENGNYIQECCNSLQELYLDYSHISHQNHKPYSPCGEGQWDDEETGETHDDFRGRRILIHPKSKSKFNKSEDLNHAILRINKLFPTRTLNRYFDGEPFKYYDEVIFTKKTIYSLDTSTNLKKTITNDIKFINQWICPEKYLQLLPQYSFTFPQ